MKCFNTELVLLAPLAVKCAFDFERKRLYP